MPVVRPLPPRPSLEYERKEAKALLRRLRAGDPDAIARARAQHHAFGATSSARARLADAQLVLAREYGFASWPRLVRWFGDVERHRHAYQQIHADWGSLEAEVRNFVTAHGARSARVGRTLAAYVPRFYGLSPDQALAAPITDADARLAVARRYGAPSWEVLLERAAWKEDPDPWNDPMRDAWTAIDTGDLAALERIVAAHPELLRPAHQAMARRSTLIAIAVGVEQRRGREAMRPIVEWLEARAFDRQLELNTQLCGWRPRMSAQQVRDLIEQGADPNWVAPNGLPVLEHALLRYWNGEAVDVVAARTTPRDALWIAAGLGDVDGVRRFLDRRGRPTAAARRLRPDFDAVGLPMASLPDPDDEELLAETLVVATLNGRTAVLREMAARGAPLNSRVHGTPVLHFAVGNGLVRAVECLVQCGADVDLRGTQPDRSARELARTMFEHMPDDADRRRIVELCGMDPDAVLAERDARAAPPPGRLPIFEVALALAADDATRLGRSEVGAENLFIGVLRSSELPRDMLVRAGGLNVDRFRGALADRLRPAADRVEGDLPFDADAQRAVNAAIASAVNRKGGVVHAAHLLLALLDGHASIAALLDRFGADRAALKAELERML
ncbi:MAG TPA: Clp protease N-terminal domain-containing protein [Gemmatimonadaceae bacterium]|nr:Clp protease N-terminal domain-containing protein [Gemmatimonadaceae bacterium]